MMRTLVVKGLIKLHFYFNKNKIQNNCQAQCRLKPEKKIKSKLETEVETKVFISKFNFLGSIFFCDT